MSCVPVRALAIGVLFAFGASSVRADEFDKVDLKKQKLVKEVNEALAKAKSLQGTDPGKSSEVLRQAKLQLEEDTLLPEKQRRDLLQQVQTRLQVAVRAVKEAELAAEEKSRQPPSAKAGAPPQGDKKLTETAEKGINSMKAGIDSAARVKFLRERGFSNTIRDVELSAAQLEEQRITERFVLISQLRKPKLDPKEEAVMKALNTTLSVDFDRARFKDVIEYLSEKTGQAIIVDENSLRDAMVEYEDPINFKVKRATVRTILRGILANKGLSYVVKEGTIQVVTQQRARDMMITKTYTVSDLVRPDPRWGDPRFSIYARQILLMNVQSLINTIQASIDPQAWQAQGGASISFYEPGLSIIVRAPAEIHYMLPQSFGR